MEMKKCTKCGTEKPATLEYFHKNGGGLRPNCKVCEILRAKEYRQQNKKSLSEKRAKYYRENRERVLNNVREYQVKNSEKISIRKRKNWIKNIESIKIKHKSYYDSNKDRLLEQKRKYYAQNEITIKEKDRKYREKNGDVIRERDRIRNKKRSAYTRERNKSRYHSDIEYRIVTVLRRRMRHALSGKLKVENSLKLLGCTPEYYRNHIESQFQQGMSWDNYGEWHIDHIIPCAAFDLSNPEEQKKCFHYTNLQPLWAEDNLKKGAKILTDQTASK